MAERGERLDYASRWMRDGMQAWRFIPTFFAALDVDMTAARATIGAARVAGLRVTYTHLIVRAAAVALTRHPEFHAMVCGQRRYRPERVDIALSVADDAIAAPVMIIENAGGKSLSELAEEIARRAPETREAARRDAARMRRWGWIAPFAFMRRAAIRAALRSSAGRRKFVGTFQISVLPEVDLIATAMFGTSAILMAGRVTDRVVAVEGEAVVRPMITLTCCADHRVFDGKAAGRFLGAVREVLQGAIE
jgi:pyruvate/2-oxoglutarate dehydrogenase complex dihydrolipoamide acyltransferase (E2) component